MSESDTRYAPGWAGRFLPLVREFLRDAVVRATEQPLARAESWLELLNSRFERMERSAQRRTVSVLLIGKDESGKDVFASWSGELEPGEVKEANFVPQFPIRAHWLIGLNGALLEHVRIGVVAQAMGPESLGPVARMDQAVVPGMWIFFNVRLGAKS